MPLLKVVDRDGKEHDVEAKSGLKLISPPVFYAILMLAAPLATVLVYSVMTGEKGAVSLPLTLDNYYELFTKPIYRALMGRSLMVSFFVTAATVGYGDYVPTTPASRIFFDSETRTPRPELSMYPVWLKSTRNLRSPRSSSSSTFCFSS